MRAFKNFASKLDQSNESQIKATFKNKVFEVTN